MSSRFLCSVMAALASAGAATAQYAYPQPMAYPGNQRTYAYPAAMVPAYPGMPQAGYYPQQPTGYYPMVPLNAPTPRPFTYSAMPQQMAMPQQVVMPQQMAMPQQVVMPQAVPPQATTSAFGPGTQAAAPVAAAPASRTTSEVRRVSDEAKVENAPAPQPATEAVEVIDDDPTIEAAPTGQGKSHGHAREGLFGKFKGKHGKAQGYSSGNPNMAHELVHAPEPIVADYHGEGAANQRACTYHCWTSIDYLRWKLQGPNYKSPLLTGGDPAGSVVLVGGQADANEYNGVRFSLGWWLEPERLFAFEIGGFVLEQLHENQYFDSSNGTVLARPFTDTFARNYFVAEPGLSTGNILFSNSTRFYAFDAILSRNLIRSGAWSFDTFIGAKQANLLESLEVTQNTTGLVDNALTFGGVAQAAGSTVAISDIFRTSNRFYGAQLGARGDWVHGAFSLNGYAKVGLGVNVSSVNISGSSTVSTPENTTATLPGGILALPTNSGEHSSSQFSVVPEFGVNFGFQMTPNVRLQTGYTVFYWTDVLRPGQQVNTKISGTQVPTDPTYGTGPALNPTYSPTRSDFWAHGFNVGLVLTY